MILSGQEISTQIREEIQAKIAKLGKARKPHLSALLIGNNPASEIYLRMKERACQSVGITSNLIQFDPKISEKEVIDTIVALNRDTTVDGILVQLPLPLHISTDKVFQAIDPAKDVDGFHPINMGKLLLGQKEGFIPCTPLGIQELLKRSHIATEGKHVVILGRSSIVGKPLAALLMQKEKNANATVTLCHSQTEHIEQYTQKADILIAAMGFPRFVKASMVKQGACVIDVGITREGNRLVGDVDFEEVLEKCGSITPVPKGVGPMTVAMLLFNTLKSYLERK